MKALVLEEYNRLVYKDWPDPEMKDDEVLVRVKAAGICGSDVKGMDGSTGRRIPPVIMGHEAAGVIVSVGRDVKGWKAGDRVTFDSTIYPQDDWYTRNGMYNLSDNRMVIGVSCEDYRRHGAFAELVSIPGHILYRIPDKVSFSQAAMVEPLAVAAHAAALAPVDRNHTSLVMGTGMIGLFLIQVLRLKGCSRIIAVDLDNGRLKLAGQIGADVVLNPSGKDIRGEILQLTENRGADSAFEAVGVNETVNTAISAVRKGATVTLVGNITPTVDMPIQVVVTRQIRLQGSCAICGEYPEALDMIASGKIKLEGLLSAEAPLSEGAGWFRRLYGKEPGLMKVILKPGE